MQEITPEFLALLLGKSATEMQEILKPVTEGTLLTAAQAQEKLQPLFTEKFKSVENAGFSTANKKIKEKAEADAKALRQEIAAKLGVDLTESAIEMLDAGIAKFAKIDPAKITEADIVKHELYAKLKADKDAEIATIRNEFQSFKGELTAKEKAATVKKVALPLIEKLGLAIPDGVVGENIIELMFSKLIPEGAKIEFDTLGNPILSDKDGALLKDPVNQNVITFEQHFQKHATGYLLPKSAGAQGGGTGNHGGNPPPNTAGKVQVGSYSFSVPKNVEEFTNELGRIKDKAELESYQKWATEEFKKQQAQP